MKVILQLLPSKEWISHPGHFSADILFTADPYVWMLNTEDFIHVYGFFWLFLVCETSCILLANAFLQHRGGKWRVNKTAVPLRHNQLFHETKPFNWLVKHQQFILMCKCFHLIHFTTNFLSIASKEKTSYALSLAFTDASTLCLKANVHFYNVSSFAWTFLFFFFKLPSFGQRVGSRLLLFPPEPPASPSFGLSQGKKGRGEKEGWGWGRGVGGVPFSCPPTQAPSGHLRGFGAQQRQARTNTHTHGHHSPEEQRDRFSTPDAKCGKRFLESKVFEISRKLPQKTQKKGHCRCL